MIQMSLKTKILLLAILPLIMVASSITLISVKQAKVLSEQEIQTFEEGLLASKRAELKNYVSLALTSIAHLTSNDDPIDPESEAEIKKILHGLTYGEDGYFFVYDPAGVNLVHPTQPNLVGKNLFNLRDINGDYVIRNLLRIAKDGGGFHRYYWQKPSQQDLKDKLSYVVQLPKLGWMMGTGLYIDDISREIAKARSGVNQNIRKTFFTILSLVSISTILIVLIGIGINIHESRLADSKLQRLAHKMVQFQVSERRRFSRELHDGINQLMVSVKFRLETAINKIRKNDSDVLDDLNKGGDVLNEAIQEVRRISHDLRPSILDDLGFKSALNSLLSQFEERTGLSTSVLLELPDERLPEDIEITLYRVVQEALTNIERHAKAEHIELKTRLDGEMITLEITDNGNGFSLKDRVRQEGIGLRNMQERVQLLGGDFKIVTSPGKGVRVMTQLPFNLRLN